MRLRPLLFALVLCASRVAAAAGSTPSGIQYRCDLDLPAAAVSELADGWQAAPPTGIHLARGGVCWARVPMRLGRGEALGFVTTRSSVELHDGGTRLGSADRFGHARNVFLTMDRVLFTDLAGTGGILYARLAPSPYYGYDQQVALERVDFAAALKHDRSLENVQTATLTVLLVITLIAALFAIAQRDANYALFALYALGVAAISAFRLDVPQQVFHSPLFAWLWFCAMYPLTNSLGLFVMLQLGRFADHSPRERFWLRGIAGLFLMLPPLWTLAATPADHVNSLLNLVSLPLLYTACWRGWRKSDWVCLLLLIGNIPNTVLWAPNFVQELTGVGWIPDLTGRPWLAMASDLLLPLLFLVILALRSLALRCEALHRERHDPITGLLNRESLQRLDVDRVGGAHGQAALVVNVKRFKAINEVLGAGVGDRLLDEVGHRLRSIGATYLARLHADQFCMVMPISRMDSARAALAREFSQPVHVGGQAIDLAIAVGAASAGRMSDEGEAGVRPTIARLVRNAEIAVDVARTHRLDWVEYDHVLEVGRQSNLGLMSELSRAVARNEFRLYLQPKVRLDDAAMISAEALLRWQHPRRGLITPEHFIPFAEKTGCVRMITRWVVDAAMELAQQMRAQGKPIQIAVNLSASDLTDTSLLGLLERLLEEKGASASDIRLEVTEHSAMSDPAAALEVMRALRRLGFSLAIDDFGTGYSSLSYLQKMPVAELKVDRAFVTSARPGAEGFVLLESIIGLGHRLGLSVVAEGVETPEEWTMLRDLGCDFAQGHFVAAAMDVDAFGVWRESLSAGAWPVRRALRAQLCEAPG